MGRAPSLCPGLLSVIGSHAKALLSDRGSWDTQGRGAARFWAAAEACFSLEGRSPLKHTEVFCSIASRSLLSPSYYHSFGITENYIVFLEQPFKLDVLKMLTAYFRGVNWASCITFHREDKVRSPTPGWPGPGVPSSTLRGGGQHACFFGRAGVSG